MNLSLEVLTALVFFNLLATFGLWRSTVQKPGKLKKKYLKELLDSKPITPTHQRPKPFGNEWGVSDWDRRFFPDFDSFADVVNEWLADEHHSTRWRLQELPNTETRLHRNFEFGPTYGRRYLIFYNQVRQGELEVSARFQYSTVKPEVRTYIELEWPRLLWFETIQDFLTSIADHVCDPRPNTQEYFRARLEIDRAMMEVMWKAQQYDRYDLGPDWGQLNLQLSGTASWYLEKRQRARGESANLAEEMPEMAPRVEAIVKELGKRLDGGSNRH
jgi:hypothetical protein